MTKLKILYKKSLEKWEKLLQKAKTLDLDDEDVISDFFDNEVFVPCAFCEDTKYDDDCRINKNICDCQTVNSETCLLAFNTFREKKYIIKWMMWVCGALKQELNLLLRKEDEI